MKLGKHFAVPKGIPIFQEKLCKDSLGGFGRGFGAYHNGSGLGLRAETNRKNIPADAVLINAKRKSLGPLCASCSADG